MNAADEAAKIRNVNSEFKLKRPKMYSNMLRYDLPAKMYEQSSMNLFECIQQP